MTTEAHHASGQQAAGAPSPSEHSVPFDPNAHLLVPPRTFDELQVGEVFRAPSRTLTDAHAAAFQTVSMDNHPVHYDVEWARKHGHTAPVVHGLLVLACTAPGATLFPHVIGESFIAVTELSCTFVQEVHAGDTLYPALTITAVVPGDTMGTVVTATIVHNQRGELVLSGEVRYVLRRRTEDHVGSRSGAVQPWHDASIEE